MGRSGSRWVARKRIISHFPDHISTDHIKGNSSLRFYGLHNKGSRVCRLEVSRLNVSCGCVHILDQQCKVHDGLDFLGLDCE